MDLIGFLVAIIVSIVVLWALKILLTYMELPAQVAQVVLVLVGVLCLLFCLGSLGVIPAPGIRVWRAN